MSRLRKIGKDDVGALFRIAVGSGRRPKRRRIAAHDFDELSAKGKDRPSLRWIVIHLIEEYARHNGHADLLREAIDGQTG